MRFNEINLVEPILRALEELNYEKPSPIQEKTIPLMLDGKDVLGCAQTGSGKTAAFALPVLQLLSEEKGSHIRALVMTPTRELAIQICENMTKYGKYLKLTTGAIYGGVSQKMQMEMLEKGVDILIATPGRLLDLMGQGLIQLNHIQTVVLDEADRMLDMGFVNDIRKIMKRVPNNHQTVMFSATMPKPIERLADTLLNDPVTVKQDEVTHTVDTVSQYVYYVDACNKIDLLTSLVKTEEVKSAIVFTNTKYGAEKVMKQLLKVGVRSRAIHGDKGQNARQDALLQFKNHKIKVLVATDVAARGIDISQLSHVFNFDIPENPETYIHRIGRTGRAGLEGVAINFCCIDEMDDLKNIERHIGFAVPKLESKWPMTIFQKKVKETRKQNTTSRRKGARNAVQPTDEGFDITKVKDISLSGKAINKRSKYQYNKERFGQKKENYVTDRFSREKSGKGRQDRDKFSKEQSGKNKSGQSKYTQGSLAKRNSTKNWSQKSSQKGKRG